MKNNEFFRTLNGKENPTIGEYYALSAWVQGRREGLDFPLLTDSMWEQDVPDFLESMLKGGGKFGFYVRSTAALENIVLFTKDGWKLTDVVRFDEHRHYEGLVFEK